MTQPASSATAASVLIVDQSEETREVLRTVLERRGVDIWEAQQAADGLEILRQHHPAVVVLDLEVDASASVQEAFENESQRSDASLVVLGRVKGARDAPSGSRTIEKPYHYGPLIRTIEQLLKRHGR